MEKEEKITLLRIIFSSGLLLLSFFSIFGGLPSVLLCVVSYLIIGADIVFSAIKNVLHGEFFDEFFLMSVATVGALIIGEYPEAAAVMLFYRIGEFFQDIAVEKSHRSIETLLNIRPDFANLFENGEEKRVSPDEVPMGAIIIVKPGERIPLDGVVTDGFSSVDTSALTGESIPRDIRTWDSVFSGCVNLSGLLKIKTSGTYAESTVAKILELVEKSDNGKAKAEKFITRFSKIYTPSVVAAAVLLAVVPSLFTGAWSEWIYRALIFLVISCPCALVVSVPLGFFGGIGALSGRGILVKGSNHLETLAKTDTVIFDKTGTLTKGSFAVTAVHPEGVSKEKILEAAAFAESYSTHPIARSVLAAYSGNIDQSRISFAENIDGSGIRAVVDGKTILAGNENWMHRNGIGIPECPHDGVIVHVAENGVYLGHLVLSDEIKPDAPNAVRELISRGIAAVMLTGDTEKNARTVASALGIPSYSAELLPQQKAEKVSELMKNGKTVAFVGDGINDAPVIKMASVGIAMGALGSDAAIEAADIVLTDDNPSGVVTAIKTAKKTLRIVRENIVFSLFVKAAILLLGALGLANMWLAVFADVGVTFLAVLNSLRAMK